MPLAPANRNPGENQNPWGDRPAYAGSTLREVDTGALVARVMAGVWRESPSNPEISEAQLADVTRLLYASGSAALGWWRIRNSSLADSASGELLHDAYRRSRLNALIHEREIKYVLSLLRAEGIEPILVKGWAIARHYPDRALRPYGDIDLCVRPDQFARAEAALKCLENIAGHYVDLHDGFTKFGSGQQALRVPTSVGLFSSLPKNPPEGGTLNTCWDALFERSELVSLGEEKVRVLGAEDHLRILCLHLLRSGAWRPLWLCDIALAVESRGPDFDWARCLGADPLVADWVACTIGLAQQLLGADVNAPSNEFAIRNSQFAIPRWLAPAVLRQWGRARGPSETRSLLVTLVNHLTDPKTLFREFRARWDRPVIATFGMRAPMNNFPRAPYQCADLLRRSVNLPSQLTLMMHTGFRRVAAVEFSPVIQGRESRTAKDFGPSL
ncbi:MAG: hypothetical protein JWM21_4086 [Acidobacteria bacterium]|nr:hypothetical protein [Acidobacteriota bacterium]